MTAKIPLNECENTAKSDSERSEGNVGEELYICGEVVRKSNQMVG